ncbi:alpha/beta hydrolase [Flavobacterium amniphilum]|uniref:alpha/beta fold hydrolase n=1 Tax=Flavobacterium amniphilum TaxID=1834035 RepID=UPI002029C2D1|nr:alpha/beta hydrolase [Flavobacterium amniphilum]MCL9804790.1 alpha/beta hydrolase [Flavobacterium amniphilum]
MRTLLLATLAALMMTGCNKTDSKKMANPTNTESAGHYATVNGLKMYYEIHGKGYPLVLIHGGGSTIETTFGKVIGEFAKTHQVIAVEMQAHGRTSDRNSELTFEQDADDVAALLKNLNIEKANFFGFSNGGTTALQVAIRHPEVVNKIIAGSALCKRDGVPVQFWDFMKQAHLDNMPPQLKEAYKKVAEDPDGLQVMHDKDAKRMLDFKDIPDAQIKGIKAPTLIMIGDKDVITTKHATEVHTLIPNSQLAIIPGGHGEYIGEVTTPQHDDLIAATISVINKFLSESITEK